MMIDLFGKVAVVTGASRGIGRAIAERLGRDGAKVVVNYAHRAEEANAVVAAIIAAGGDAIAVQADVTRRDDITRLFAVVDRAFGRLDILVNNAGAPAQTPLEEIDVTTWDRIFALNAKAPLFVTQEAAKRLGDGGRIINVCSSTTDFPLPNSSVYAASKAVPRIYTEVLAKELGPLGVTVNSVVPGPTATGMLDDVPDQLKVRAAAQSPFNRIGHPDDIAAVVSFLASQDAAWVTGQHILANGGATI